MPPEAILQRPSVLSNVLALLQSADKGSPLPAAALRLLHALVSRIKRALAMAKDELYLPNATGEQTCAMWHCRLGACAWSQCKLHSRLSITRTALSSNLRSC